MPEVATTVWVAMVSGGISTVSTVFVVIWVRSAQKASEVRAGDPWLLRAPLLPLVLAVVSGLVAVYALILHFAFGAVDFQLPARANVTSPILVAATLIAGTLTAAYAVLKIRAHLLTEARGRLDASGEVRAGEKHRNDQEAAYSERFAEAVKLLADERPISRIAGAHLVLAIGNEWKSPGAQQRCLDVLLSHLRGLNRDESFDDESESRSSREEVRLITSEVLRHLSDDDEAWEVTAGDFTGAVIGDFDLTGVSRLPRLDLRGTRILGDLFIPSTASGSAPRLSDLTCEGALDIEVSSGWTELDLTNAEVGGSVTISATGDIKTLTSPLGASGLTLGGDLNLAFDSFQADVVLDSASIEGRVAVGSPELGAAFGTRDAVPVFSAVGASFGEFSLRRAAPGPRLDLADATGRVDLSGSRFDVEVTANNLDASTGLHFKDASFGSLLVLDGASTPSKLDLDGVTLSDAAIGSINSSDFGLRDQLLALRESPKPDRSFSANRAFDWESAIAPYRDQCDAALIDDLEERLARLAESLPVDWHARTTFTAKVMSAVSRAVARTEGSPEIEDTLQRALRDSLQLAADGQEAP